MEQEHILTSDQASDHTGGVKETDKAGNADEVISLAQECMMLARDSIVVYLRFFAPAVYALVPEPRKGLEGASSDGKKLYYDPFWLIEHTKKEPAFPLRLYLHSLLHLIFFHGYGYDRIAQKDLWDLSADLAVENVILELALPDGELLRDADLAREIEALKEQMNPAPAQDYAHATRWEQSERSLSGRGGPVSFTADKIFAYLLEEKTGREAYDPDLIHRLRVLSKRDVHFSWEKTVEITPDQETFRKMAQRIKADLKSFSAKKTGSESLFANLREATRERTDYRKVLSSFAVYAEDMKVSEDEFDYIFYTYGLREYGNMPLIEPLEYTDEKKIRDFVIVIDTSASCRKGLIEEFLQKTVEVLSNTESFFTKVNIHVLQCDDRVRSDTVIHEIGALEQLTGKIEIRGLGATDFRPAFAYADQLIEEKKLQNLRGLIYFTDGYGVYPEKEPAYKTMFVFPGEDESRPILPIWAAKVILD